MHDMGKVVAVHQTCLLLFKRTAFLLQYRLGQIVGGRHREFCQKGELADDGGTHRRSGAHMLCTVTALQLASVAGCDRPLTSILCLTMQIDFLLGLDIPNQAVCNMIFREKIILGLEVQPLTSVVEYVRSKGVTGVVFSTGRQ